ncbi:MAG: hypothetical protein KDA75_05970 [Planctomycetaceae bacterium]|nr:hypothetical protein [Planctomycetaceae bacterium]
MSATTIAILFLVFGIALAGTIVWMLPPTDKDVKRRRMDENPDRPDPSYVP